MSGTLGKPNCLEPLGSSHSKGTGLASSPLPLYGAGEGSFLSQSQNGLKQAIFSPQLLGDNGGATCPAQREVKTRRRRRIGSYCRLALEPIAY